MPPDRRSYKAITASKKKKVTRSITAINFQSRPPQVQNDQTSPYFFLHPNRTLFPAKLPARTPTILGRRQGTPSLDGVTLSRYRLPLSLRSSSLQPRLCPCELVHD